MRDLELEMLQRLVNSRCSQSGHSPPSLFRCETEKKPRQPERTAADESLLLLALVLILAADGGDKMLLFAVLYIMM